MSRRHRGYTGHCKWTIEEDEDAFDIDVSYSVEAYDPGNVFGPAENCYPPEGGNVELVEVTKDGAAYELSEAEEARVITWLEENSQPPQAEWDH